jgi:RNA polymerase sigma-70 factor (ECF subfamily)
MEPTGNIVVEVLLRERIRITAAARMVLHDPHSADDVFQQVVLLALQSGPTFREPSHIVAWALKTARHRALNLARARQVVTLDDDVMEAIALDLEAVPSEQFAAQLEALNHCVETLPPVSRRLLQMRYTEGQRCGSIAERLGRTVEAVYQSLSRLHKLLRGCVEERLNAQT